MNQFQASVVEKYRSIRPHYGFHLIRPRPDLRTAKKDFCLFVDSVDRELLGSHYRNSERRTWMLGFPRFAFPEFYCLGLLRFRTARFVRYPLAFEMLRNAWSAIVPCGSIRLFRIADVEAALIDYVDHAKSPAEMLFQSGTSFEA